MVFLDTMLIAILTATVATFAAGFVAALAVDWYHVSPREGGSGYFIAAVGIMGLLVGIVISCICGSVIQPESFAGFFKTFGWSAGIVLSLTGIGLSITRLLADIPPIIDGEDLFLIVEFKFPATQTTAPILETGDASVMLGSIPFARRTVRRHESGPLFLDEAQLIDGRWIVRGAVEVFTRRGKRMLSIHLGSKYSQGFFLPLPARPGKRHLEWSDWLPRFRPGVKVPQDMVEYRFRIQRWSTPMRTQTVGPFEIDTITRCFQQDSIDGRWWISSRDTFRVRYHGQKIGVEEPTLLVASIASSPPSLVVTASGPDGRNPVSLLREIDGQLRTDWITDDYSNGTLTLISPPATDTAPAIPPRYVSPQRLELAAGIHRVGGSGIIDTRTLAIHRFKDPTGCYGVDHLPVLTMSPDERSFVRYALLSDGGSTQTGSALAVTDYVADRSYLLPIDRPRMHYLRTSELNAGWVLHHFEWKHDESSIDQLVERANYATLPYRGEIARDTMGHSSYRLDCVEPPMRETIERFLIDRYKAELLPGNPTDYEHHLMLDGKKISIAGLTEYRYAHITMDADAAFAEGIFNAIDAELATGRYDSLFKPA